MNEKRASVPLPVESSTRQMGRGVTSNIATYGPEFTNSRIFQLRLERAVLIFGGRVLTLRTAAPIEALPAYAFFASAQFVAVPVDGEPAPDPVRL